MPNDAFSQQALAADHRFLQRLANAYGKVAWEVLNEDPTVPNHTTRAQYAQRVNQNPYQMAQQLAPSFVNRPNVFAFTTSYDFTVGGTVTASGDADIESQLHTDWDDLAGVIG
jgi:hypothetical protein